MAVQPATAESCRDKPKEIQGAGDLGTWGGEGWSQGGKEVGSKISKIPNIQI